MMTFQKVSQIVQEIKINLVTFSHAVLIAKGTFMGVIVTCILNTFGVVIFERLGWVTGQAGVAQALMMYGLSYVLVFITVLSVASSTF
jgi:hypothetical protein